MRKFFLHIRNRIPLRYAAIGRLERLRLRRILRNSALVQVLAGASTGAICGLVATSMQWGAELMRRTFFALQPGQQLSTMGRLPLLQAATVLVLGGIVVAATIWFRGRRPRHVVDPIEANALFSGRMSLRDSVFVALQSLLSSGFGLSLGIEGGYTQLAGALGSKLGQLLNRRRHDVRMLVGAGAAGAIAGAFGAPFAGAAYAFELIIGSYTVANLAPVVAAAVAGSFVAEQFTGHLFRIPLDAWTFSGADAGLGSLALGGVCGLLAIALMWTVTLAENVSRRYGGRREVQVIAGGLLVGVLAAMVPHILGSGHGAMAVVSRAGLPISMLLAILLVKGLASAISLGTGFRGGLFSTSLFLGMLTGALTGNIGVGLGLLGGADIDMMMLVGMASFGAAIIGAPMTMALLAIEVTQSLDVAWPVLLGVATAALTVRQLFGYSFATWRFHLRGETIASAQDIGWLRETTAGDLMSTAIAIVPTDMPCVDLQGAIGTSKIAVAVDRHEAFAGIVDRVASDALIVARSTSRGAQPVVADTLVHTDAFVDAATSIGELMSLFETLETETVIVIDDRKARHPIGFVSEAFALKRYRQELETRQKEIFGN